MEELSIWQEVMMEKYPEKTMTLNNFFEELSYNDLPIFIMRNLYGASVFPIVKTAIVLENGENEFYEELKDVFSFDKQLFSIWNGHFTLLLKDKDDKKKVSYEIQIFDDYILVRQNIYIIKEL
jgi:hypothetical protein